MKRTTITIALIALLVVASVATPVAGADDDDLGSWLLDSSDDESSTFAQLQAVLSGVRERIGIWIDTVRDDSWSASSSADQLAEVYNQYNSSFESYANQRVTATTDLDVLEIELSESDDGDQIETVYLVATVDNESYTDSQIVSSTDRSVDEWVSLCGSAAREAPDELERFHDDVVEPNESIPSTYKSKLAAKYGGNVKSSLKGDTSRCYE